MERLKSDDISAKTMIILDETKELPEDQLQKLNSQIFGIEENSLTSLISSLFQRNLSLILLFSKYCFSNGVRFAKEKEVFFYYEKFKAKYQRSCNEAHYSFLKQNNFLKNETPIENCQDLMMFLDLDMKAPILNSVYLDLRYIDCDDFQIKSINVFVKEVFQQYYWKVELIELFVNRNKLGVSSFGWMFDAYMLQKLKKFAENRQILEIQTTSNQKICLHINKVSEVLYGKYSPLKKSDLSRLEIITFNIPDNNENTLFETKQQTFPLADVVYHEPSSKKTIWINWKSNYKDLIEIAKDEQNYLALYAKQAKEQLGI